MVHVRLSPHVNVDSCVAKLPTEFLAGSVEFIFVSVEDKC